MAFDSVAGFGSKKVSGGGNSLYVRTKPTTVTVGGASVGHIPTGTVQDMLDKILYPNIPPVVTLTVSPNTVRGFNETNFALTVTAGITRQILDSTFTTVQLRVSRDNTTFTTVQTISNPTITANVATVNFSLTGINPSVDNRPLYYRVVVTDSLAQVVTQNASPITFAAYSAPTINLSRTPTGNREKGITNSTALSVTVSRNSPFTTISSVQFQRQDNGGSWVNVGSSISLSASGGTANVTDTASLSGISSVSYRAMVTDNIQTTNSALSTAAIIAPVYYGVGSASPTESQVKALTKLLSGTKVNANLNFNPTNQRYVYAYPASYGAIVSIIDQNGFNVTAGFNLTVMSFTYADGQTESYNVYVSNSNTTQTNFKLSFN